MENTDPDLIVKTLVVVPRSKRFCNFFINDTNEKRSMKHEEISKYITKLCPAVGGKARAMIYEFRPFYIEIETETIQELEETPEEPESRRNLIFSNSQKIKAEKSKRDNSNLVSDKKQFIFENVLKLIKKTDTAP